MVIVIEIEDPQGQRHASLVEFLAHYRSTESLFARTATEVSRYILLLIKAYLQWGLNGQGFLRGAYCGLELIGGPVDERVAEVVDGRLTVQGESDEAKSCIYQ